MPWLLEREGVRYSPKASLKFGGRGKRQIVEYQIKEQFRYRRDDVRPRVAGNDEKANGSRTATGCARHRRR
jgi:hypothetical protein